MVVQLTIILGNHIVTHDLGELFQDVDTILDDYDVRRPDILFFDKGRLNLVGRKAMEGPPDLAIEVPSPSSVKTDRVDKFEQYQQAGVKHYWIIDPELKKIEAWSLQDKKFVEEGRGQGTAVVRFKPFVDLDIPLSRLW